MISIFNDVKTYSFQQGIAFMKQRQHKKLLDTLNTLSQERHELP